jgi:hypothetical protein
VLGGGNTPMPTIDRTYFRKLMKKYEIEAGVSDD